jgi:hypothetical protein
VALPVVAAQPEPLVMAKQTLPALKVRPVAPAELSQQVESSRAA